MLLACEHHVLQRRGPTFIKVYTVVLYRRHQVKSAICYDQLSEGWGAWNFIQYVDRGTPSVSDILHVITMKQKPMKTKTGYEDSRRQDFNIKFVFFCPWDTENRCFSFRLITATSKKIMNWISNDTRFDTSSSGCSAFMCLYIPVILYFLPFVLPWRKIMNWTRENIVENSDLPSCFGPCSETNVVVWTHENNFHIITALSQFN